MYTTHIVSVRELRQHLSLFLHAIETKKVHFVLMRYSEPVGVMTPFEKKKKTKKQLREEMIRDMREADEQWKRGEWYSSAEVRTMLGVPPGVSRGSRKRSKN